MRHERDFTGKLVLVIEDDPLVGRATVGALQRVGFVTKWLRTLSDAGLWLNRSPGLPIASLLDLQLPDGAGEDLIPKLREVSAACRILAVSGHLDGARACALLRQGIACIPKPVDAAKITGVLTGLLVSGIDSLWHESFPSGDFATCTRGKLGKPVHLTHRESHIVGQLVYGMANKQIAQELGCSVKTVEFHVTNLLRKTGVASRAELVGRALGLRR